MGCALWWFGLIFWATHQVFPENAWPIPAIGNVLVYVHAVAFLAGFALRPHQEWTRTENRPRLLDFALLVLWWVYLYLFAVVPWRYVFPEFQSYRFSFNAVYTFELLALQLGIGMLWLHTQGKWRRLYFHYLIAGSLYAIVINGMHATHLANGSVLHFHLPLAMILFYFGWIGWRGAPLSEETPSQERQPFGLWRARAAMAAILSIPFIAIWSHGESGVPPIVQNYRLVLSLIFIVLLTGLLFLKQYLLDLKLIRLLDASQTSIDDLHRMQDRLLQTEKLASIGRLVAGAAHEINNPLTAILGYADMLSTEPQMPDEYRLLASKILQQARRTKSLIANLLIFAKQKPGDRNLLCVNTIVGSAIQARELDLDQRRFKIQREFAQNLPQIMGDETQLVQVFSQILNNAVDALTEVDGGTILISTSAREQTVQVEIADTGPGVKDPSHIFDPFYTTKPIGRGVGLGLSACYGIVQEHGGEITCANHVAGGAVFRISLPVQRTAKVLAAGGASSLTM